MLYDELKMNNTSFNHKIKEIYIKHVDDLEVIFNTYVNYINWLFHLSLNLNLLSINIYYC